MASNKKLNPVDIKIDSCMDADDLGQRLVDCVRSIDADYNVVNLIKVHVGEDLMASDLPKLIKKLVSDPLQELGATNCVFVPIKPGVIENVTVDHIEVRKNDLDN